MKISKLPLLKLAFWLSLFPLLSGCYLYQQASGQLGMRWRQEAIPEAIKKEDNKQHKELLQHVSKIKKFAESTLFLKESENYSDYFKTEQKGVTFAVTASSPYQFKAYKWWFPIVGSVPYLGFYKQGDALEEKKNLEEEGYDTYMFAVPAYSTLGWFKDPVTTPMLRNGLYYLTKTIIHELTHVTLYVEGQSRFNEQLASFVAKKGVIEYYEREKIKSEDFTKNLAQKKERYSRYKKLIQLYIDKLKKLYHSDRAILDKRKEKKILLSELANDIVEIYPDTKIEDWQMNNARLLQYTRYRSDSDIFEDIWKKSAGNWRKFWVLVQLHVEENFNT